jgi:phosphoribosylaminoimidazole carboxylase (NCAIR synthetase)
MDRRTVGILGGGQLGRMLSESSSRLGIKIAILDPGLPIQQPTSVILCNHLT